MTTVTKKINCILLVDNDHDDNFFSEWIIKKGDFANIIIAKESSKEALAYLREIKDNQVHPDLIFLDINMPRNGGMGISKRIRQTRQEATTQHRHHADHFK